MKNILSVTHQKIAKLHKKRKGNRSLVTHSRNKNRTHFDIDV